MALSINFYDQYLLITGGTRGIGAAVAQEAIESGGHVVITGTASEPPAWLAECQQRFPAQQLGYEQLDLAADDWLARVDAIVAAYPAFSVLINNAGITRPSDIRDEELTEFAKVIQVNLTAPAMLSARVALGMTAQCYGRIVNISSVLGITSIKGRAAYSSTKRALSARRARVRSTLRRMVFSLMQCVRALSQPICRVPHSAKQGCKSWPRNAFRSGGLPNPPTLSRRSCFWPVA
ncbi:MAG: SDR family oxidoreductase [Chloroflexaceae bacterium]|nr:SDR family oxidoreductase [Chloroflexaceae bacterium]